MRDRMASMSSMQKYIKPVSEWPVGVLRQTEEFRTYHSRNVTSFVLLWCIHEPDQRGRALCRTRLSQQKALSNFVTMSDVHPRIMGITSRSVRTCKYERVRGESTICKNAEARIGPISSGPSPNACNKNLIPPVLATRSTSIKTMYHFFINSSRLIVGLTHGFRPMSLRK